MYSSAPIPFSEVPEGHSFLHKKLKYLKVSPDIFNGNNALALNRACLPRIFTPNTQVYPEL